MHALVHVVDVEPQERHLVDPALSMDSHGRGGRVAVDLEVHDAPVLDAGRAATRELDGVVVSGDADPRRGAATEGADQAGAGEEDVGVGTGGESITAPEQDALAAGNVVVDRG